MRRKGFALLLVLISTGIAAALAAAVVDQSRGAVAAAQAAAIQGEGALAADAGLRAAAIRLAGGDLGPPGIEWRGWTVAIAVEDEAGKVDLNRGATPLNVAALAGFGVSQRRWEAMTAGRSRPFVAVDELAPPLGLDQAGLVRLSRLVTVHGDQVVDRAAADPLLRRLAQRSGRDPLLNAAEAGASRLGTYTIRATASRGGQRVARWAIVRMTPAAPEPFEWLEQG